MRETENNKRYKAAMQGVGMQNVKMQQEAADKGSLQVNVTSSVNSYPISEARISISYTGVPENTLEQLVTDSSGQTDMIELDAPPEEWSLDPENERQPYSEYNYRIRRQESSYPATGLARCRGVKSRQKMHRCIRF